MRKITYLLMVSFIAVVAVAAQDDPNTSPSEPKKDEPVKDIKAENPYVRIATSKGDIYVELYIDKAPITVKNFLRYTQDGFYDGKIFHRVMKNFMIQGGGMTLDMVNKLTKKPIKNESYNKLRNARGTIAMARKNDPDSATSQFYINHKDNKSLDFDGSYAPGYAVFGRVVKGMEVVDAIASVKTKNSQYYDEEYKRTLPCQNVPVEPIVIKSVKVVRLVKAGEKNAAQAGGKDTPQTGEKENPAKQENKEN